MRAECEFEDCDQPILARGWCSGHYSQWYRGLPIQKIGRRNGSALERDEQGRKLCTRCWRWEPVEAFSPLRQATTADRLMAFCRECCRLRKYNLTREQYAALLVTQGGVCAMPDCESTDQLCVDHDHDCCPGWKSCGKCVRGILCRVCNARLGMYEQRKAAFEMYLEACGV